MCVCDAHYCIIKINKNENKIILCNHKFVRKKQNGGWKVSDADWFYFSFYGPSWSESNFIIFLFFYSIRVDPSWSDPDWRSELIRSDFCTCLKITAWHASNCVHGREKWFKTISFTWLVIQWQHGPAVWQLASCAEGSHGVSSTLAVVSFSFSFFGSCFLCYSFTITADLLQLCVNFAITYF